MTPRLADEVEHALAEAGADALHRPELARYGGLVLDRNRSLNLTAARTPEAFAGQILDALTLLPYAASPLIDVGSGAGLPGIVLAIAGGCEVTLVDATAKKVAFLADALRALDLPGRALAGRAEELARDPELRERFACATARAVGPAPTVLELTLPFLCVGGRALLQRGAWEPHESDACADAALVLGGRMSEEITLGDRRRIVVVDKVAPTVARFPRRAGVPARRPLCLT